MGADHEDLMNNMRKITLEAINHIVQNDSEFKFLNQLMVLKQLEIKNEDIGILLHLYKRLFLKSHSEFRQDIFVLSELNFKQNGFFVEFGACDGIAGSNTWLLEKDFAWKGILAEPNKFYHPDLGKERNSFVEHNCVWSHSHEKLIFNEVTHPLHNGLSTIEIFSESDRWGAIMRQGHHYPLDTISLVDLLEKYQAPREIDYLSIDTEGSEYEILAHHDFDRFSFHIITCEHNFGPTRDKIYNLLSDRGYVRKLENISGVDDWYVRIN